MQYYRLYIQVNNAQKGHARIPKRLSRVMPEQIAYVVGDFRRKKVEVFQEGSLLIPIHTFDMM